MAHALIWKYTDADGEVKVLAGHPGAYGETEDKAVEEARITITELGGYNLQPLGVVETDSDVEDDIYACDEVYLGPDDNDQLFYDISRMGKWARQPWWPNA